MTDVEFLADQLRRAHRGQAWHGPSLTETLAGVTAEMAANRPLPQVHTIAEIARHIGAWLAVVGRRLRGETVELSPDQDWPPESSWQETLDSLDRETDALADDISKLPAEGLRKGVPGQGSVRFMLEGVIQHHLYHAGQIALLKKIVAS